VMSLLELRKVNSTLNLQKELLERRTKNLDTIVAERISEIEGQKIELEKANNELQAFNYISSHDLQEPLRKIQIFASLVNDRDGDRLSESGKEYIMKIGKASARMSHLIKDLLAYSRTSDNKAFDTVSLKTIVDDVVEDLQEEINAKNAKVALTSDAHFNAIAFQFRQVIQNLLSNSLKFSRPGITPEITISYERINRVEYQKNSAHEKQYHLFTFKDNGIGFDSKYSEKIFQLFQRLETKDLKPGTGIGLAIVKKIISNHQGLIFAESKLNEGTTFKIHIPI
jgi:light-regulated signal transduction histidine kinase (bacteriophytochrome)